MHKYLYLITGGMVAVGCSMFNGGNDYPTVPLPPQKTNASDAVMPANPRQGNASHPISSSEPVANTNRRTIQEDRSNGQVTQIKVDNGNNDIPDYYIYPSQQQNLNTNSTPDKNLATPSWQISW